MALEYTKLQETLRVEVVGTHTLNGSAQNAKVINLEASPYAHGLHCVGFFLQNGTLTGDVTVKVNINPANDGSGTDVTIRTATIDQSASEDACVIEIPTELIGHYEDRNSIRAASLVLELTGTNTDTIDVAVVAEVKQQQDGLTENDVASVS